MQGIDWQGMRTEGTPGCWEALRRLEANQVELEGRLAFLEERLGLVGGRRAGDGNGDVSLNDGGTGNGTRLPTPLTTEEWQIYRAWLKGGDE